MRSAEVAVICSAGLAAFGASACATGDVVPVMRYSSAQYVKRVPVSADVLVSATTFNVDGTAKAESERKLLADSLRSSVEEDLKRNGPFWINNEHPKVRIEIAIDATTKGDTTAWRYLPPWIWGLFGVPTYSTEIVVTGSARVLAGNTLVTESAARGECTSRTGVYYNWSVELGCAAEEMMEQLRKRLGDDSTRIVDAANAQGAGTTPIAPVKTGGGAVVAVFDVEDGTKQLDESLRTQLSDYVAVKLAEVIGFRIVPREQLRARIQEEKASGYKACFDENCQIELGKALAAEKSVATKIIKVGSMCTLSASIYDLKTETTERGATAKAKCEPDALMAAIDQLVTQLAK